MKTIAAVALMVTVVFGYSLSAVEPTASVKKHPDIDFDTNNKSEILVNGKLMRREDALPLIIEMLDGDVNQQTKAVIALGWFGDSLGETKTIEKILQILETSGSLDNLDKAIAHGRQFPGRPLPPNLISEEDEKLFDLKSAALKAVVMSNDPRRKALLQKYLNSKSESEREVGKIADELSKKEGFWKKGMIPAVTNRVEEAENKPGLVLFQRRAVTREIAQGKAEKIFSGSDIASIKGAIADLRREPDIIKGSKVVETLESLFKRLDQLKASPQDVQNMKENIILIMSFSGGDRTIPFLEDAQKDPDPEIKKTAKDFYDDLVKKGKAK